VVIDQPGDGGAVVERWPKRVEGPIADGERLAGVEEEHALRGNGMVDGQDAETEECGDEPGLWCCFKDVGEGSGVVAVWVGELDPAQLCGVAGGPQVV
jgi:hypothetical protein